MAFKVLIVDDEAIIRRGIRKSINWEEFDCEVVADAASGEQGLMLIKEHKPDIVITDIRMKKMTGLEMISEAKDYLENSKVILLTGYRDFEYAQQAINMGVVGFLLKPTKFDELIELLNNCVNRLKQEKGISSQLVEYRDNFRKNRVVFGGNILTDIINGKLSDGDEIKKKLEIFDLSLSHFVVISAMECDGKTLDRGKILKILKESADESATICLLNSEEPNSFAFVISDSSEGLDKGRLYEHITDFCFRVKSELGFFLSAGVSLVGTDAMQLCARFNEAEFAMKNNQHALIRPVLEYENIAVDSKAELSETKHIKAEITDAIKNSSDEALKAALSKAEELIRSLADSRIVNNIVLELIGEIYKLQSEDVLSDRIKSIHKSMASYLNKSSSCDELVYLLREIAFSMFKKIQSSENINQKLRGCIEYVDNHYMEQISISDVANNVYISSNYVNRLFKNGMNITFSDYLNSVRIEKAKKLLKDSYCKTYEIAQMVGVPNHYYFSRLFKKFTGVTPTEYRNAGEE